MQQQHNEVQLVTTDIPSLILLYDQEEILVLCVAAPAVATTIHYIELSTDRLVFVRF